MPISGHAHGGLGLSLLLSLMELHPFSFSFFSFHFLSTFLGLRTRGSSQFLDFFVPQKHSTTSSFSTHPFLLLIFDKHRWRYSGGDIVWSMGSFVFLVKFDFRWLHSFVDCLYWDFKARKTLLDDLFDPSDFFSLPFIHFFLDSFYFCYLHLSFSFAISVLQEGLWIVCSIHNILHMHKVY